MGFTVKSFEDVRDGILRDIANQNPKAVTGVDSDYRIRANAVGAAVEGLYQHQAWIARQIFPDTADEDNLELYASRYGIVRKAATAAAGSITFNGTPGSTINAGTESKSQDGKSYIVMVSGVMPVGGSLTLAAQANFTGLAGNQLANTALTLTSAPPGVTSTAFIVTMNSGTDIEDKASLLARLLDRLRRPPAGGNKYDYERWAREVPGVTDAYCYPARRGLGTVDVAVFSNGTPASSDVCTAVNAYISDQMPANVDFMVLTPQLIQVPVSAALTLSNVQLPAVQVAAQAQLQSYFATLKPGDVVRRINVQSILASIPGVIDVVLTSPSSNVVTQVDAQHVEFPVLAAITLGT
ncbi:baseplate J/gp47 family protein [Undibacterium sp. SXout11W]|uniref:baseplate J/gp47 family protein n=1 Tax=Undibacterium sp. SXout11W TaxID=3413050 RepID=UPI003BEFB6E4